MNKERSKNVFVAIGIIRTEHGTETRVIGVFDSPEKANKHAYERAYPNEWVNIQEETVE